MPDRGAGAKFVQRVRPYMRNLGCGAERRRGQLGANNFWLAPAFIKRLGHLGWGFGPSITALGVACVFVLPRTRHHASCLRHPARGLLSEKYLGRPEPRRPELNTVSLQKYKNMIHAWGGSSLFQELLAVVKQIPENIGAASPVSVSATFWTVRRWPASSSARGSGSCGDRRGYPRLQRRA